MYDVNMMFFMFMLEIFAYVWKTHMYKADTDIGFQVSVSSSI